MSIQEAAIAGDSIHTVATADGEWGRRLYYSRAPVAAGQFEPVRDIFPDVWWSRFAEIECGDDGTCMILGTVHLTGPWLLYAAQLLTISRDNGNTWSPPDTVSYGETSGTVNQRLSRDGHHWIVAWVDTVYQPGFEHYGYFSRFSANNGRSWYPRQQIEDEQWIGHLQEVIIEHDRVRLFSIADEIAGTFGNYFLQWEGTIDVDTAQPALSSALEFPVLVPPDTMIVPTATASDNDSLWLMRFVAFNPHGDTIIIPLYRISDSTYAEEWMVPPDTTLWYYYYHAEDMWENISYYPEGGPENPLEMHVGEIQSARVRPTSPTEFSLSIFPNPSNGNFTITGSYSRGTKPEAIAVYDVLGREVIRLRIPPGSVDRFTIHWDATNHSGQSVANGVYFLRPLSYAGSHIIKIAVIR